MQFDLLVQVTDSDFKIDTNIVVWKKMTFELRLPLDTIGVIDTGSYKKLESDCGQESGVVIVCITFTTT